MPLRALVKADFAWCNADAVVWLMAVNAGNPAEALSLSQKPGGDTLIGSMFRKIPHTGQPPKMRVLRPHNRFVRLGGCVNQTVSHWQTIAGSNQGNV